MRKRNCLQHCFRLSFRRLCGFDLKQDFATLCDTIFLTSLFFYFSILHLVTVFQSVRIRKEIPLQSSKCFCTKRCSRLPRPLYCTLYRRVCLSAQCVLTHERNALSLTPCTRVSMSQTQCTRLVHGVSNESYREIKIM